MGLAKYHEKRRFNLTPEPRGKIPKSSSRSKQKSKTTTTPLRYYIQEHHASHLHYDFRLEMDGVLRSWAVPKGPSQDPSVKRLAVEVEDHPIEYGTFEGIIPEKQYGAGRVILWDHGTYKSEVDPVRAIKMGRLDFELMGKKLRGRWLLVRTGLMSGEKRQWLLIKRHDDAASEVVREPTDVLSKREPLPKSISPQLAKLEKLAPLGEEWSHEIKLDGYRVMTRIEGKRVRLLTRSGLDWTERFETVRAAISKLGLKNTILDGEIVVFNTDGKSDFQALQNALSENRHADLRYCIFDLLFLNGNNLTEWPLDKRRLHLKPLLKGSNKILRYSDSIVGEGRDFFKEACRLGLEGVISKKIDSPYSPGRGHTWIKSKCENRQEFVIGGYTDSTRPGDAFASLLLGVQETGGLRYVGKTGTGFTASSMASMLKRFRKLAAKSSPFAKAPAGKGNHWLKPELVAEVNFATWTSSGHLRQASFKGLREDKNAKLVIKEAPEEVKITHPEKVLFSKAKITKQDLLDYYSAVEKWILPQIAHRPLTIVRCPNGEGKTCFYQRHIGAMKSSFVTETVHGKNAGGTDRNYISIENLNGIRALVQIGTLEFHAWNTTVQDSANPRELIFDLDPGPGVSTKAIYHCAVRLKELLEKLKLKSFVNLSGSKGLHIHVPIAPIYEWEDVKDFSHSIVKMMMEQYPDLYTDNIRKVERQGRIFIDYLRNSLTSTSVVPYSVRNRPDATVAVPISWSELKPGFNPRNFTIKKTIERLRKLKKDPWKGMRALHQRVAILDK